MRASVSWWSPFRRAWSSSIRLARRNTGTTGPATYPPVGRSPWGSRSRRGLPGHRRASFLAVRDWTFLLGPGVMAALNALSLGTLMYPSGLVPRAIPLMGLIGAPLLLPANLGTMFGVNKEVCL
jgi:Domain of unknown function (DUF4386)